MPTLTLDFSAAHAQRIAAALGRYLNLTQELTPEIQADPDADPPVIYQPATYGPRSATLAEAKQHVRHELKSLVWRMEKAALEEAVADPDQVDIT